MNLNACGLAVTTMARNVQSAAEEGRREWERENRGKGGGGEDRGADLSSAWPCALVLHGGAMSCGNLWGLKVGC